MKKNQAELDYRNKRYNELKDKLLAEKERKDRDIDQVRRKKYKEFLLRQVY